jgi:uncharacterized protein (DUF2336 family)
MNKDKPEQTAEAVKRLIPLLPFLSVDALVDLALIGNSPCHLALATAEAVSDSVSAVLAELGEEESVLALLQNSSAKFADFSFIRIVERFHYSEAVLGALELRPDLDEKGWAALATARLKTILAMAGEVDGSDPMAEALIALLWAAEGKVRNAYIATFIRYGKITPHLLRFALLNGANGVVASLLSTLTREPLDRVEEIFRLSDRIGFRRFLEKSGFMVTMIPDCEAAFVRATAKSADLFSDAA